MVKEIDKRCLKMKPYEYFCYCDNIRTIRGAAVITDKQSIFYSQLLEDDYRTHDSIQIDIESKIHTNSQKCGYYQNHAYIASVGKELIIILPENGELSLSQAKFLTDILEQTDKYNNEISKDKPQIKINLFDTPAHESYFDIDDIEFLKQKIKERITKNITIEEEKIIGTTLSKEEIKSNLLEYLDLKKCSNLKEVRHNLIKCQLYYQDSYYKDIFNEIFPNYIEIEELTNLLYDIDISNKKVENANFQNIKDIIYSSTREAFKDKNSYHELFEFFFGYRSGFYKIQEETKNKIFPNFNLISQLFKMSTDEEEKYIESQLKNILNYEEFSKMICNLAYNKKSQILIVTQNELDESNKLLEKIKIENNIIASKDILNEMIDRKNKLEQELNIYNSKLETNHMQLDTEEKSQDNKSRIIQDISSNFLKKVLNKRKINEYTIELNNSKLKSQTLRQEREEQLEEIKKLQRDIQDIEKKFKDITRLEWFPTDKSFMEIYYTKNNFKVETSIIELINMLNQKIELLKKELLEISSTGLIISNDEENTKGNNQVTSNRRHH